MGTPYRVVKKAAPKSGSMRNLQASHRCLLRIDETFFNRVTIKVFSFLQGI